MYGVSPVSVDSPGHFAGGHVSLVAFCDFFDDFERFI
jgi:hypothetical protein